MPRIRDFRDPRALLTLEQHIRKRVSKLVKSSLGATDTSPWTTTLPSDGVDEAIKRATAAHGRHQAAGETTSPLSANDGHTVAVKDNIVTSSLPTSAASNILRGYAAPENATIVRLMEEAGMLVLGKTNMDEFGMGSHSRNTAFGRLANGRYPRAISVGGSSGGSAMAVAQELSHVAIGTDTGGSVRLPAAYMNLVGFKPSYGQISRYGLIPYANSLDTVGIIAKSCLDVFLLYRLLSKHDPKDPTCLDLATRYRIRTKKRERVSVAQGNPLHILPMTGHLSPGDRKHYQRYDRILENSPTTDPATDPSTTYRKAHKERRIGVPAEYNIEELQPQVRQAWERTLDVLASLGHTIVPVSLPSTKHALSAYYVLAPAEASSNLAKYDGIRFGLERTEAAGDQDGVLYSGHRGEHFGEEVKRRILLGTFSLSAGAMDNYFIQAQKIRRVVQDDFNMVFSQPHPLLQDAKSVAGGVDFLVCPTAPSYPPSIQSVENVDPLETYMNDVFTVPASLAGLPAISIPAFPPPHMLGSPPQAAVGMQIIGQFGDDEAVIQFARRFFEVNQSWDKLQRSLDVKWRR